MLNHILPDIYENYRLFIRASIHLFLGDVKCIYIIYYEYIYIVIYLHPAQTKKKRTKGSTNFYIFASHKTKAT